MERLAGAQALERRVWLIVRAVRPSAALGPLGDIVHGMDRGVPIWLATTMDEVVRQSLFASRLGAGLLAVVGLLALALVGVYGVVAYGVSRRTRALGIRASLGASRPDLSGHGGPPPLQDSQLLGSVSTPPGGAIT